MKVEQMMTPDPACCTKDDLLKVAGSIMGRVDTGIVPIVKSLEEPVLVGVITDRDLCLAILAKDHDPTQTRLGEIMSTKLAVCRAAETAEQALTHMRRSKVRRLPVVNNKRELIGLLSLGDIFRHKAAKPIEVWKTLAAISTPTKVQKLKKAA